MSSASPDEMDQWYDNGDDNFTPGGGGGGDAGGGQDQQPMVVGDFPPAGKDGDGRDFWIVGEGKTDPITDITQLPEVVYDPNTPVDPNNKDTVPIVIDIPAQDQLSQPSPDPDFPIDPNDDPFNPPSPPPDTFPPDTFPPDTFPPETDTITNIVPTDSLPEIVITGERPSDTMTSIVPTDSIPEIVITGERPSDTITNIVPTDSIPEIVITGERPSTTATITSIVPTDSIPEIVITGERPSGTGTGERPSATGSSTEEISEIVITAIRPSQTPTTTVTFSFTQTATETETDTIPEIIITTDRPTQSPTTTVTFSFTQTESQTETETDTIPEIVITTDRPTQSPTTTVTFSISETETETETVTETETPVVTTPRPTFTYTFLPTFPPTFPPTLPPTLPPTQPPATVTPINPARLGLNPGLIEATPFYNTSNDAQAKYYWGAHPFQYAPNFDPNIAQQGFGPTTPFGIQNIAKPLTPQDMQAVMAGTYRAPTAAPATRIQQYNPAVASAPAAGPLPIMPTFKPFNPNQYTSAPTTTDENGQQVQTVYDPTMNFKNVTDAKNALDMGQITPAQYAAISGYYGALTPIAPIAPKA